MLKANHQHNKFVCVEGNIGVGKSTLLPQLAALLDFDELQEPVDDPEFARLLDEFYHAPDLPEARIRFQHYITNRRANLVKELDTARNYILERSLYSDLVFSQANFLTMERPDAAYMNYYYLIKERLTEYPQMNLCVYLRSDPKKSFDRMMSRGREAEMGTPLSYIEDIHNFHDAILPQICRERNTPLLVVDWSEFGDVEELAKTIRSYF